MSFSGLSDAAKEDMAVSLAVLILHDSGNAVTADAINAIVSAAGVTVAPYWGSLMSKFIAGRNIDDLLLKPGMGGAAPAAAASGAAPAAAGGAAPAAAKKEEKKEEEEEAGGAGGLFGGDDDW
jgi:large subunit ribosomal protein LP1